MDEIFRLKQEAIAHQNAIKKDRERLKPKPNENMELDIPERIPFYDFWCNECQKDFKSPAIKTSYRLEGIIVSTIRGKCQECDEPAIRYATHRDQDPYYQKSKKVRRERNKSIADTLSAEDYGFKTLYGNPYENELWDKINTEKEILRTERSAGIKGYSLETKKRLAKLHGRK